MGNWIVKWQITSFGVNGIYNDKLNVRRYFFNWIHFVLISIAACIQFLFIIHDSLWYLIDNEFAPKNMRRLLINSVSVCLIVSLFRFDTLYNEWYNNLKAFKSAYYLQENIPSKHGLTSRNHFELSVLRKVIKILLIKIYAPLFVGII